MNFLISFVKFSVHVWLTGITGGAWLIVLIVKYLFKDMR